MELTRFVLCNVAVVIFIGIIIIVQNIQNDIGIIIVQNIQND